MKDGKFQKFSTVCEYYSALCMLYYSFKQMRIKDHFNIKISDKINFFISDVLNVGGQCAVKNVPNLQFMRQNAI